MSNNQYDLLISKLESEGSPLSISAITAIEILRAEVDALRFAAAKDQSIKNHRIVLTAHAPRFKLPLNEPLHSIGKRWVDYAQDELDPNDVAYAIWAAIHEVASLPKLSE